MWKLLSIASIGMLILVAASPSVIAENRILLMYDDSRSDTVRRSLDIDSDICDALAQELKSRKFETIDEKQVLDFLKAPLPDRASESDVLGAASQANESGNDHLRHDHIALISVAGTQRQTGFATVYSAKTMIALYRNDGTFVGKTHQSDERPFPNSTPPLTAISQMVVAMAPALAEWVTTNAPAGTVTSSSP